MGIRVHDTNDNLSGISKPVQQKVLKEMAKQAQDQKNLDQNVSKQGKYIGNAGTR
jgi:hypothetical protein